jgi:DUF4097 and DUF4098 domain-containing protein YvlB
MALKRRPSLLGALLWTGLGVLFLLRNFGIGPDFWSLAGRYWPVLLILLGLGKILDYFFKRESVSIRFGEIIGILLLLMIGTAISRISASHVGSVLRDLPIEIGGTSMQPGRWIGESHTYTDEVTYPLESQMPVRIENSYGSVSVNPGSNREIRVRLKKVIYGGVDRTKSISSEIRLHGEPEAQASAASPVKPEAEPGKPSGSKQFVLRTNRESLSSRDYAYNTDIEVFVPKNSQVQVVNSYGDVRVSELNGALDLSTTHRSLELRDCTGQFNISTRYAECRLTNLKGNLNVNGHGRVYIEKIVGDVMVSNEYAPVEIISVDGKLTVSSTEGPLRIENVSKPVIIEGRGTQIQVTDLKDSLKIKASHRGLDISNVASGVTIESRYATLNLKDIKGNVEIDSNSDNVSAEDIGGRLQLKGKASSVRANGVKGPLDIQTTLKDVLVNDFQDSCSVSNEYAAISISSRSLGKGDVKVRNRNGDVDLFLPEGASFSIDATARNGKVESDYAGLAPTRDSNTGSLKSRMKSGVPKITLETDYSDIHIYRSDEEDKKEGKNSGHEEVSLPSGMSVLPSYL